VHKFINNYSKLTIQNTIDYSGHEKLFGKTPVWALAVDHPRHQGEPQTGTLQKHKLTLWIVQRRSEHHPRPRADRPTLGADRPTSGADRPTSGADRPTSGADRPVIVKQEKPEGDGFDKIHFWRPRGPSGVHDRTVRNCFI
jgi:hypothetical protein